MLLANKAVRTSPARLARVPSCFNSFVQRPRHLSSLAGSLSKDPVLKHFEAGSKQHGLSNSREFSFPDGTMFEAPNVDVGLAMAPAYARSLITHGVVAIQPSFNDPDSEFILSIIEAMGCRRDTHSASHGALWDIKFKPEGVRSEATGKAAHSISHSMSEFSWHTDGAYENNPTRFFGFHILRPDHQGGGIFRVLRSEDLIQKLSTETIQTLIHHEYDLKVPDEFFKGERKIRGKLLSVDQSTGNVYVRYRQDIIMDPPSEDGEACKAVEELNTLLGDPENRSIGEAIPSYAFKENTVLLMDNARFLHSRTKIKDTKRWLRRVRFHGTPGGE
jgi:hypothetical protein